jgi:hypothetical protein
MLEDLLRLTHHYAIPTYKIGLVRIARIDMARHWLSLFIRQKLFPVQPHFDYRASIRKLKRHQHLNQQ